MVQRTHIQSIDTRTGEITERVEVTETVTSTSTTHKRFTMFNKETLYVLRNVGNLAKNVFLWLLEYEVKNTVDVSVRTLREELHVSKNSIYKAIKELENVKAIKYENNRFILNSDLVWSSTAQKAKAEYYEAIEPNPVKRGVAGYKQSKKK